MDPHTGDKAFLALRPTDTEDRLSTPVPTWGLAHSITEPKASGALEEAREVESLAPEKERALDVGEVGHAVDKYDAVEEGEFALVVDKEDVLEEGLEADKDDALDGGREEMFGEAELDEQRETCSVKIDFSRQMFGKRDDILDSGHAGLSNQCVNLIFRNLFFGSATTSFTTSVRGWTRPR